MVHKETTALTFLTVSGMSCLVNALQGAAQNDETLRLIDAGEWDRFALGLAENAPAVLGDAVQVFKTQAQKNKFAIGGCRGFSWALGS